MNRSNQITSNQPARAPELLRSFSQPLSNLITLGKPNSAAWELVQVLLLQKKSSHTQNSSKRVSPPNNNNNKNQKNKIYLKNHEKQLFSHNLQQKKNVATLHAKAERQKRPRETAKDIPEREAYNCVTSLARTREKERQGRMEKDSKLCKRQIKYVTGTWPLERF
jgi:hypothetical protein